MSRIGNNPIKLPAKVEVTIAGGEISVKGPLGSLSRRFGPTVSIEQSGDTLTFKAANAEASAMHGTMRALVANMVKGVTDGYQKRLTLVGVGYRAQVAGDASGRSPDAQRRQGGSSGADRDHRQGCRQAAGWTGRRGNPRLPSTGAVQGQGRALRRRAGGDQGNQEEISGLAERTGDSGL
jgi:hypothetical protein